MEIFIDSANIEEIKEIISWGIADGCTTNPKIASKEKDVSFETNTKEILKIVDGPVSIEVTTNELDGMLSEAEKYASWGKNVVVKIPMGTIGLKAVKILKEKGIKTNVTACMSPGQAILAAKAGADYASLFYARIGDMGYDATKVVKDSVQLFKESNVKTKIIVGSIRHLMQVIDSALAGAHVLTIPTQFLYLMAKNPKTDETINEFLEHWKSYKNK
jgi:transaldolase|tara:strand:- start:418 stop:1068 length:651 start_codon:yes stop_codon:yes gene_type:complete